MYIALNRFIPYPKHVCVYVTHQKTIVVRMRMIVIVMMMMMIMEMVVIVTVMVMVVMVMMIVVLIDDAIRFTNATEKWLGTHSISLSGMKGPNMPWSTFISWYIHLWAMDQVDRNIVRKLCWFDSVNVQPFEGSTPTHPQLLNLPQHHIEIARLNWINQ